MRNILSNDEETLLQDEKTIFAKDMDFFCAANDRFPNIFRIFAERPKSRHCHTENKLSANGQVSCNP